MTKWNDERSALLLKPRMTKADVRRLQYLNSALDSYSTVLEDGGELPTGSWIDMANSDSRTYTNKGHIRNFDTDRLTKMRDRYAVGQEHSDMLMLQRIDEELAGRQTR